MGNTSRIFGNDDEPTGEPDRYHSLVEIGRGGMAVVYRAWDSHMNREVALKVAREEVAADPEVRRRFEEESRIGSNITHASLLPVYDRGVHKGRPYMAMQLVEGTSLDHAKLPLREAITCLAAAAEAVHHAHQQGIVHRDLKPSNILVARDGRIYLTDFGVARQAISGNHLTVPGTVVGTPAYMSPEQARGEDVDALTDVYALGATLYELAVGRPPYAGADAKAVLEAVRAGPPTSPRKANPEVSRNVEAIIRMAMERHPGDRYPTAQALAEDLKLYGNRRRPLARARGIRYYVVRELVRHPIRTGVRTLTTLLILGALVLGGLAGRGWFHLQEALQEPDPVRQVALLRRAAWILPAAREKLEQLQGVLAGNERRRLEEAAAANEARLLKAAVLVKEIGDALFRKDPDLADRKLRELEPLKDPNFLSLKARLKQVQEEILHVNLLTSIRGWIAAGELRKARDAALGLPAENPERSGFLAQIVHAEYEESLRLLRTAAEAGDLAAFEPRFDELASTTYAGERDRDPQLAQAARALASVLSGKKDRPGAIRWLTAAEKRGSMDVEFYRIRGLLHLAERNWDAAERDLGRRPAGTPEPTAYWELHHQRAKEAIETGQWLQAEKRLRAALDLSKQAVLWHDLGLVRWKSSLNPELALGDLHRALSLDRTLKPAPGYVPVVLAHVESSLAGVVGTESPADRDVECNRLLDLLDQVAGRVEDVRIVRAELLRRRRRFDDALVELSPAAASVRIRLARARVYAAAAQVPGAAEGLFLKGYDEIAGAALGTPDDPAVLAWRALLGARLGRPEADADFEAAQPRGGVFPAARLDYARLLQGKGAHGPALKEVALALAGVHRLGEDDLLWLGVEPLAKPLTPARTEFRRACLMLRAQARIASGDVAGGVEDLTLLLDEAPTAELRLLRGLAYLQMPKPAWAAAALDLEAYLPAQPDDYRARLALANAYLQLERYSAAVEQCTRVLEKKKDAPEPYYLRGLAREFLSPVEARSDFEKARDVCPPDSPLRPRIMGKLKPK